MSATQSTNRTSSSELTDRWYELYGNSYGQEGCHVSNDGPVPSENGNKRALATLRTCNITQYMCTMASKSSSESRDSSNLDDDIEAIEVLYEYEVSFNSEVNVTGSLLPYLEESMLENLASKTGISQCRLRLGSQNRHRQRMLNENSTNTKLHSRFLGINSQPRDVMNTKYTSCKSTSSSSSFPASVATECVPIFGGLTVFVQLAGEDRQAIRDTISQLIQDAMDNGAFVVPASIERVSFVGNSTKSPLPPFDESMHNSTYNSPESSPGRIIALVFGVLFFISLIVSCFCFARRRRARRSRLPPSSTVAKGINESAQGKEQDTRANLRIATGGAQQCLASLDSLALRDDNGDGSLVKITERDINESSCETSQTSSVESNSLKKVDKETIAQEIHIGGKVEMEEFIGQHEDEVMEGGHDIESIVAPMSDELDLLDQLALHGHPPSYPSPEYRIKDDLRILTPSRSLSPTTISAASQSMMYTESRKIVGSPTTCSQSTMRAGNLRYFSTKNRKTSSSIATTWYPNATVSTAYTPDSFDEEILGGVTSDDSEKNQYQIKGNQELSHIRTFADVLNGHDAYINDDLMSLRSDNENTNTVQRHLQMS
jgi:hypothetical protein